MKTIDEINNNLTVRLFVAKNGYEQMNTLINAFGGIENLPISFEDSLSLVKDYNKSKIEVSVLTDLSYMARDVQLSNKPNKEDYFIKRVKLLIDNYNKQLVKTKKLKKILNLKIKLDILEDYIKSIL